ncbi:MAG: CHASE4 domain-containing protein [Planctomycetota bacterium]|jgi:signal transduction histidine kinase
MELRKIAVSLQVKILIIVLAVVGLYAAVDYGSQRLFVLPSFISLERTEAENTIRRCAAALKREISNLDRLTQKLADSDAACQLVNNQGGDRAWSELKAKCFDDNHLNVVYICDDAGRVVSGEVRDFESTNLMPFDEFPVDSLLDSRIGSRRETGQNPVAGIYITRWAPLLVASSPVRKTAAADRTCGWFTTGRFLDDRLLKALAEQTSVDFKVRTAGDISMSEEEEKIFNRLETETKFHIQMLSGKQLRVYATLSDIRGAPALLLRADLPRDIKSKAIAGFIRSNLLSNLTAGLIVTLVLWVLLRNTVVGPISRLTRHVMTIGSSEKVPAPFNSNRQDEIGTLAREFGHMVEQLAESRKRLSEQCYLLGKAEVASGVLHNARNVLTPLVSRIGGIREKLREVPINRIETAQAELEKKDLSYERQQGLNRFINLSSKTLVTFVRTTKDKLDDIAKSVAQVEEMLHQQGKFSHAKLPAEEVRLYDLVRDSVALLPKTLCENVSIEIDPSVEAVEPMTVHSITVLQVFSNIILNAAESISRTGLAPSRIAVRVKTQEADNPNVVHVEIRDDGEGIEPENLARIFERGYSTKHNVPSGIGLHWCANAVATMDGQIYAESEGKGCGACFHILLPALQKAGCVLGKKAEVKS